MVPNVHCRDTGKCCESVRHRDLTVAQSPIARHQFDGCVLQANDAVALLTGEMLLSDVACCDKSQQSDFDVIPATEVRSTDGFGEVVSRVDPN
jgi:hypothetical protein